MRGTTATILKQATATSAAAWVLALTVGAACAAEDILIADFEGKDYGEWTVTGEALGSGPAHGTLPNQMGVSGFEGQGLVNTFYRGDGTIGTLTSPPFKIERSHLNFLLGGGHHPDETCINLIVDGKVAHTATGPNDRPGGTERLDWHSWDVAEFAGKMARIEIVDKNRGGWGHINVDQIVQSDLSRGVRHTAREIRIKRDYLVFQVCPQEWPRAQVSLRVEGKTVRSMVGADTDKPYWVSWDVSKFKGRAGQLNLAEKPSPDGKLVMCDSWMQSDKGKGAVMVFDKLYQETYRPQFHFTPMKNWTNDPNGLVYYKGEYHLFFQHNPKGIDWGNMTWGHAVSRDLVHWTQLDHAIYPDKLGTIFSGSAVVDVNNTAGFQTGKEKVIVCIYTSAGGSSEESKGQPCTQSIAYSNDRGRTWTKYEKNPVLPHIVGSNRDPKVIWHEPTKKWVMALFLDGNDYALFGSSNLKEWTKLCDVPMSGSGECPDFFELPVHGDPKNTRWVFWGANGNYRLGAFDGTTFQPETQPLQSNWGGNCYAAQTYSNIPPSDGRRLQIAWMAGGTYPDMPFNQQMSFPRELTLRTTPEGIRLFVRPIKEIKSLHTRKHSWRNCVLKPSGNLLSGIEGELFDICVQIELGTATELGFTLRGERVDYNVAEEKLTCLGRSAPLAPVNNRIKLRILLDRTSIEVFGNDGLVSMPTCFLPDPSNRGLSVYAIGGEARIVSLDVCELRSAWPTRHAEDEENQ